MTEDNTLLQFPTHFPIKVFGPNTKDFIEDIRQLALQHFPKLRQQDITCNPSAQNHYVAITLNPYVHAQSDLDALYQALTGHPDTKMVL